MCKVFLLTALFCVSITTYRTFLEAKTSLTCYSVIACVVVVVVVVVVQLIFLSGIVSLAEMAGFTSFLLQLLALRLSTLFDSGHPPTSNQSSLSSPPLPSSKYSSVVLAFSCHSLQDLEQPSKRYCHSTSAHVHTI